MPPQDGGSIGDSDLGTKISKELRAKWLSENVNKLLSRGNMRNMQLTSSDLVMNK